MNSPLEHARTAVSENQVEAQPDLAASVFEQTVASAIEVTKLASEQAKQFASKPKDSTLRLLLGQIKRIDFREKVALKDEKANLVRKHFVVCTIEQILETARVNKWGLCTNQGSFYAYNGEYWEAIGDDELKQFLGKAAEKLGVEIYDAKYFKFQDELFKQFLASAGLPKPELAKDTTVINLKNGTFEIGPKGQYLRPFSPNDFITYQLGFLYNPDADAPIFKKFLDRVLPDEDCQKLLAEYIGYLFVKTSTLKLEKVALLFGGGSNGKSVVFDMLSALLGSHNITNYSLEKLTESSGYYRAALANKLLNYASEINGKLESSIFKQLASGEAVEARAIYGKPFSLTDYAKLMFNCNQLPTITEHTHAYFRRLMIIPFNVTISETEADPELSQKIIGNELSGIFNWVLVGLSRLLQQKKFTESQLVKEQNEDHQRQTNNVAMFVDEEGFQPEINDFMPLQSLYGDYVCYCIDNGYRKCAKRTFSEKLRKLGFSTERKSEGVVVYTKDKNAPQPKNKFKY